MKKVLVISDSFKGSLSSARIAALAEQVIREAVPGCQVVGLPVADGGEGTVDCFLQALGGQRITVEVQGPWGEPVAADYGRIGDTAVVEMAAAAGLPLVGERKNPARTSTWGVGQLIRSAVEAGCTRVILGLGGSATNDGGCGCAAALGVRFLDREGRKFCPVGENLCRIASIDSSKARQLLQNVTVEVMCDIDNPLCGPRGAAAVFAPQKGADGPMVEQLDRGLSHLADMLECRGVRVRDLPGAGAAGGFGAGAAAFLHGRLRPGIEVVLDLVDLDRQLEGCDLVLTGEGRLDGQSLGGKVPVGVARRVRGSGVPVLALAGVVGEGYEAVYQEGIAAVFCTNRRGLPFEAVRDRAEEDYCRTLRDILTLLSLSNR